MKKGISKFLSIMYGVTVLSGMLSMNSASAVYWSEEGSFENISTSL